MPPKKVNKKMKAFLVTIAPTTRIVIDTNGKTKEEIEEEVTRLAIHKMASNPLEYLLFDNCDEIKEDIECPARADESPTMDWLNV